MWPALQHGLFPTKFTLHVGGDATTITHPSVQILYVLGQLGLVFYMFVVGLAFDVKLLSRHRGQAAKISAAGVFAPILIGGAVGWLLTFSDRFFPGHIRPWQAAIFIGSAIAITAFPMLARIIYETGLTHTRIGTMALACAAVDDAVAWILLALVISTATGNLLTVLLALGGSLIYVLGMVFIGRPMLRHMASRIRIDTQQIVVIGALIALACATLTEVIGVYLVFGAFIAGAVMPRGELAEKLRGWMEPLTVTVLLPIFFVYSGLQADLRLLLNPLTLSVLALITAVAVISKGGACYVACRSTGSTQKESLSLASLMNARGLMELILLNIGLEKHLITTELYTVLALMTIATTLAASPIYLWTQKHFAGPIDQPESYPAQAPHSGRGSESRGSAVGRV